MNIYLIEMNDKKQAPTKEAPRKELSQLFTTHTLAITFAPDDTRQFWGKPNRWGKCHNAMVKVIYDVMATGTVHNIKLWPDLSAPPTITPLGRVPRIHWHGIITLKDPPQFYTRGLIEAHHYMIDIDTIKDKTVWLEYSKKFVVKYKEYQQYIIKEEIDDEVTDVLTVV